MEGDVLPWLLEAAEDFVEQLNKYEQFPNDMISGYF